MSRSCIVRVFQKHLADPFAFETGTNTRVKPTIILRTLKKASVTSVAQSARKSNSYLPLHLLLKPKPPSLPLHPRNRSQRHSVMQLPVPVYPAARPFNNNTLGLERTLSQPPSRSTRWPVSVLVRLDWHRMHRSRADFLLDGTQL